MAVEFDAAPLAWYHPGARPLRCPRFRGNTARASVKLVTVTRQKYAPYITLYCRLHWAFQ
eukprot:scaffold201144_cov26-Prasinocladus_malaysianus.AAC.1